MQQCPNLVILSTTMVRPGLPARSYPGLSTVPIGRCGRFLDGAARLKRAKKFVESMSLPMLRMLLASPLRWIVPGLELKLELSKVFTYGEIKNKTIQGRTSASWPITIG